MGIRNEEEATCSPRTASTPAAPKTTTSTSNEIRSGSFRRRTSASKRRMAFPLNAVTGGNGIVENRTDDMIVTELDLSQEVTVMSPPVNSFGTPMPTRKVQGQLPQHINNEDGRKRVVRFADESQNEIIPANIVLTEVDISKGWWTGYEIQRTARNSRVTVAHYLQRGQPLRKKTVCDFLRVIQLCMDAKDNNGDEELLDESLLENEDLIKLLQTSKYSILPLIGTTNSNEDCQQQAASQRTARGLELQLAPVLKSVRKYHNRAVLGCSRSKNEEHKKLLLQRSRQFSRPLKILARIVAQADELAVAEEGDKTSSVLKEEVATPATTATDDDKSVDSSSSNSSFDSDTSRSDDDGVSTGNNWSDVNLTE